MPCLVACWAQPIRDRYVPLLHARTDLATLTEHAAWQVAKSQSAVVYVRCHVPNHRRFQLSVRHNLILEL